MQNGEPEIHFNENHSMFSESKAGQGEQLKRYDGGENLKKHLLWLLLLNDYNWLR